MFPVIQHEPACESPKGGVPSRRRNRRGISSFEVIVGFVLFMAILTIATPLMVRHGRLLIDQRRYRLALDEVSNQLDRLGALPTDEVPAALEDLSATDWTLERLPGAALTGRIEAADMGQRLSLEISWGAESTSLPADRNAAALNRKTIQLERWLAPRLERNPPTSASPAEDAT